MKAAVLYEPYKLVVDTVPDPTVAPGCAVVRIKSTAICGTDLSIFSGEIKAPSYPVIQGHESVGVIEAVAPDVLSFKPGDKVIINPAYSCGKCRFCLQGLSNLCENGGLMGRDAPGTFAELASVPETGLIKLPNDIDYEDATSLQAMATVLRGWEHLSLSPGGTVAVIGMGTTGLLHARVAKILGASKVFAITRSRWKLDIASEYGAIPLNSGSCDVSNTIIRETGCGVDIVIDCVVSSSTVNQALELVRPGGTVQWFGIAPRLDGINAYAVYLKELHIVGTRAMNRRGYERAVGLYEQGAIDLKPLVTKRFELEAIAETFKAAKKNKSDDLRIVCNL